MCFFGTFFICLFGFAATTTVEDSLHWQKLADAELREALAYKWNTNKARNVIIFVGDGMGPDTITASRIFRDGETSKLAWEEFPHIGILKVHMCNTSHEI